jgi:hypothetical protein
MNEAVGRQKAPYESQTHSPNPRPAFAISPSIKAGLKGLFSFVPYLPFTVKFTPEAQLKYQPF